MNRGKFALTAFAAGAACMYFADPDKGRRRRTLVRDKTVKTWNDFTALADKAQRDLFNRTEGAVSELAAGLEAQHADGDILVERVRSKVGRVVSHPHAIEVRIEDGKILLKGPVLRSELEQLLSAVQAVRGVGSVVNELEVHDTPGTFPSLQGGHPRESRSEFTQQNWTPALRMAAGALGGGLIWHGVRNPAHRAGSSLAGAALLTRAVFNREFSEIVGLGDSSRGIEIDKAIHIMAPVEEVFAFWSNYRAFPHLMTHLMEVRDLGDGKSHWVAEGPGGIQVSWEAQVTKSVANEFMAWRSLPGSTIENEGVVRFEKDPRGGTRVSVRMYYKPPGGVLGHFAATLFGAGPKQEIDEDMVRLKSLLELGHTRAHGTPVTLDELQHA